MARHKSINLLKALCFFAFLFIYYAFIYFCNLIVWFSSTNLVITVVCCNLKAEAGLVRKRNEILQIPIKNTKFELF